MTEEVIIDVNVEGPQGDELDKLAKLKAAIVNNQEETAKLKAAYKSGAITIKEYSEQVSFLETKQKKLSASYTDIQRNVTGLKSPFDRLQNSLSGNAGVIDKMIPGLGSAASGILGMAKAGAAFIATPIGAVVAALAASIGLVTAAIKTNDAVADDFEANWSRVSAVLDTVERNLTQIVEGVALMAGGQFAAGTAALAGLGDEFERASENAYELTRAQQALEDQTNLFGIQEKRIKNEIDKLVIQSKDRSKTEKERIAINLQASKMEEILTNTHIALVEKQAKVDIGIIAQKHDMQIRLNESLRDFAIRVEKNSAVSGDEGKKITAAIQAVDEAQNASIKLQEKLQNQRNALLDKQDADAAKRAEEKKKKEDKEQAEKDKKLNAEFQAELDQEKIEDDLAEKRNREIQKNKDDIAKEARDKELEEIKLHNEEVDAVAQQEFDKEQQRKIDQANFTKQIFAQSVNAFEEYFKKSNDIAVALSKGFLLTTLKMLKISLQAKIIGHSLDTPDSILTLGLTGAIRAAVITAGLEVAFAAAESALEGFALGGTPVQGKVGNQGIPIRRSNGDNRLVTMRSDEVVLTQEQQARIGGPIALHAAKVPGFATGGGFETRAVTRSAVQDAMTRELISSFQGLRIAVVIEDVERMVAQRTQIKERATLR